MCIYYFSKRKMKTNQTNLKARWILFINLKFQINKMKITKNKWLTKIVWQLLNFIKSILGNLKNQ